MNKPKAGLIIANFESIPVCVQTFLGLIASPFNLKKRIPKQ